MKIHTRYQRPNHQNMNKFKAMNPLLHPDVSNVKKFNHLAPDNASKTNSNTLLNNHISSSSGKTPLGPPFHNQIATIQVILIQPSNYIIIFINNFNYHALNSNTSLYTTHYQNNDDFMDRLAQKVCAESTTKGQYFLI